MGIGVSRICPAPLESYSMEFSEGIVNTGSFGNVYVLKYTARATMFPQTNNDGEDETRDDDPGRGLRNP